MLMSTSATLTRPYPLNRATAGEWVRVVRVSGSKSLLRRLLAMGMSDGCDLEIIYSQSGGGVLVCCAATRWALGQQMAQHIWVATIHMPTTNN